MLAALDNGATIKEVKDSHDWRMAPMQVKSYVEAYADIRAGFRVSQSAGVRGVPCGRFEIQEVEGGSAESAT